MAAVTVEALMPIGQNMVFEPTCDQRKEIVRTWQRKGRQGVEDLMYLMLQSEFLQLPGRVVDEAPRAFFEAAKGLGECLARSEDSAGLLMQISEGLIRFAPTSTLRH